MSNDSSESLVVKLSAEIGTQMQAELSGIDGRIKLTLLGIFSDQYLIYQIPQSLKKVATDSLFKANISIKVRCISRGIAFGFSSSILYFLNQPDLLLFVKYPSIIQKQTIRKNQRVKCLLPATLNKDSTSISGTIADLSRSGCHFLAKKSVLNNEQLKVTQEEQNVEVGLSLPGIDGAMMITATIRNTFVDSDKAQFGIQFNDVDDTILSNIDDFVAMSFELAPF